MKAARILFAASILLSNLSCGMTEVADLQRPASRGLDYPVSIEPTNAMRRRSENAWRAWLLRSGLPNGPSDLDPLLAVPRSLPAELANRISISDSKELLTPDGAREALRQFIARGLRMLAGEPDERALGLQDLSLISFAEDGALYRATYRQTNFSLPVANGYGDLRIAITRQGGLVQLTSRLLPPVDMPSAPTIDLTSVRSSLVGRVFSYRGIDGRALEYRVSSAEEVIAKSLVIYPRDDGSRLVLHLAYPLEVGRGVTWTVFIDAIDGKEIDVKQNFNT
jgi:hypothetical protein